ncbi:phosphate ABC transporter permease PstA [Haloarcula laminariae]|uniref:phosphate ABC transporter permease PstA n=1 Tax=Haloarcula laminariae TaxID=2961577 RepID=UPI0021C5FF39|nr:phosphate ABC transporter permease PstA [Halomicroarcula laminariae]
MATPEQGVDWAGDTGQVSRLRGVAFEATCLAAVSFALVSVLVLLLYVSADALRPFSADPGWHLVFFLTLVVPSVSAALFYYRRDDPAGEVAYATTGLPVVGVLGAAVFAVVLDIGLVTAVEMFALLVSVLVAAGIIVAHARYRPRAAAERMAVLFGAPVVTILGVPPAEVTMALNMALSALGLPVEFGFRLLSLREAILLTPVVPLQWIMVMLSITVPVSAALGGYVARERANRKAGLAFVGGAVAASALAPLVGPVSGIGATGWVLLVTFCLLPVAVYVEGVVRRREGIAGLTFPLILVGGVVLGALLVDLFGFAPPDPWLDWSFLTSAHSRTPAEAGFYPPIVGSVMMLIVIALSTFPVGVGAAIYLEEYAPDSGLMGKFITLIEINIGNLAGVPSVVYGLLGLTLFVRVLTMPTGSVIVGGLAIGILILPIVIISAQEAIRAVPDSHREAAYGMGATRWQTTRSVVLPQAIPGILTGTILAVGRAIGETAPLLMIGAASSVRLAPSGFFDLLPAMPRQIFAWSTNLEPEIRHGVLAAGVVTLLVVLLIMNGTAILIRNKYQREA